jgi:hypothetical protein
MWVLARCRPWVLETAPMGGRRKDCPNDLSQATYDGMKRYLTYTHTET